MIKFFDSPGLQDGIDNKEVYFKNTEKCRANPYYIIRMNESMWKL